MSMLNKLIISFIYHISYHRIKYIIKRVLFPYVSLLVATKEIITHFKTVFRYMQFLKLFLIFSVVFVKFHDPKGLSLVYIKY